MGSWFRSDGSEKRNGFLGPILRPDGDTSTELSIGVPIFGKETEIPSMIPGISGKELNQMMTNDNIPANVIDLARRHAAIRMATNQSPFAGDNDSPTPTRSPGPWKDEYLFPDTKSSRLNSFLASLIR
jgi:hypothetical protein